MTLYYLIDPFTTNGDIVDVVPSDSFGELNITGTSAVRIPSGVSIQTEPATYADLMTAKADGLLASFAGYGEVTMDPCNDLTNVDLPSCDRLLGSAGFLNHGLLAGGVYTTTTIMLATTPTTCVIVWEEAELGTSDAINDSIRQRYEELDSNLTAQVSFDGGATFIAAINGGVTNIPVPSQGDQFILELTNGSPNRTYLGSWAIVY